MPPPSQHRYQRSGWKPRRARLDSPRTVRYCLLHMLAAPPIADDALGAPPEACRLATELLPLLYEDVRALARRERRRVGAGVTMQTTALVHEAYLKLLGAARFNDRQHFLRASSLAMRHILINHARKRTAEKRGGGISHVALEEADDIGIGEATVLIEINEALGRLAQLSPRLAQIVECRFFAGFSDEQTAQALGLTGRTVRRDWVKARAWLRRELSSGQELLTIETP
jgi:RNA polymerase sigma factor (TIGR02999 family)